MYTGETIRLPPAPKREGCVFDGWENLDGTPFDVTKPFMNSAIVRAVWVRLCTVKYMDENGRKTIYTEQVKTWHGATYVTRLTKPDYINKTYVFDSG